MEQKRVLLCLAVVAVMAIVVALQPQDTSVDCGAVARSGELPYKSMTYINFAHIWTNSIKYQYLLMGSHLIKPTRAESYVLKP